MTDRDGVASSDQAQCTAAGGSWRPRNSCCNFFGSTSCPFFTTSGQRRV